MLGFFLSCCEFVWSWLSSFRYLFSWVEVWTFRLKLVVGFWEFFSWRVLLYIHFLHMFSLLAMAEDSWLQNWHHCFLTMTSFLMLDLHVLCLVGAGGSGTQDSTLFSCLSEVGSLCHLFVFAIFRVPWDSLLVIDSFSREELGMDWTLIIGYSEQGWLQDFKSPVTKKYYSV